MRVKLITVIANLDTYNPLFFIGGIKLELIIKLSINIFKHMIINSLIVFSLVNLRINNPILFTFFFNVLVQ